MTTDYNDNLQKIATILWEFEDWLEDYIYEEEQQQQENTSTKLEILTEIKDKLDEIKDEAGL